MRKRPFKDEWLESVSVYEWLTKCEFIWLVIPNVYNSIKVCSLIFRYSINPVRPGASFNKPSSLKRHMAPEIFCPNLSCSDGINTEQPQVKSNHPYLVQTKDEMNEFSFHFIPGTMSYWSISLSVSFLIGTLHVKIFYLQTR